IVAGVCYVIYEQVKNDYEIKSTFQNGSCPNFKFKEEQLLERKLLLNSLITILTPVADKLVSSYFIVLGEHGVEKSTLIRQTARTVCRGVIYVDVPSNVDKFGLAFARTIKFDFKEHIRLSTWIESKMFGSSPDEGTHYFQTKDFFDDKKYGCVPVLILDNCDTLANKDPKVLEILQDTAKTAIDDSSWITVFVTSVGIAPEQMEAIRKSNLQNIARRIEKIRCRTTIQEQTFLFNVLYVLSYQPEITIDELIEIEKDATIRQKKF
ncbi:unnamed protein product, partial [Rotaria sp. Silwood2]